MTELNSIPTSNLIFRFFGEKIKMYDIIESTDVWRTDRMSVNCRHRDKLETYIEKWREKKINMHRIRFTFVASCHGIAFFTTTFRCAKSSVIPIWTFLFTIPSKSSIWTICWYPNSLTSVTTSRMQKHWEKNPTFSHKLFHKLVTRMMIIFFS